MGVSYMISIPKTKLMKFGISIKCNRKRKLNETKAAKWTQNIFCEGICSENSMIKIEKGKVSRYLENYYEFSDRLGLKITYDEELDKQIDEITKIIYTAIEYYDFETMRIYFDKLYELLEPMQEYLWYGDLYHSAVAIGAYYLKREFINSKDRNYYADMANEFSDEWNEVVKAIVFISAYNDMNNNKYLTLFDKFKIDECKSAFNKVNTMLFLYDQDRTKKLLSISQEYEKEWQDNKNDLRLLDLYGVVLPCFSFHDVYELNGVYNTLMDILESHKVSDYKKAECYNGIGIAYYNLELYKEAIENLLIAYKNDKKHVLPLYVHIAHAQRMLGQKVNLPYYSREDISKHSVIYQRLFEYFHIVEEDYETIEKFIMNRLIPVMNKCTDKCIFELMEKEIGLVSNSTNHYKLIMRYNEKVKVPEELKKEKLYFRRIPKDVKAEKP